jgi:hypothetical protein
MSSLADQIRELAEACRFMSLATNNPKWTDLAERSKRFADRLDWGDFPEEEPNSAEAAAPRRSISPPLRRAA